MQFNWETAPYSRKGQAEVCDINGHRLYVRKVGTYKTHKFRAMISGESVGRRETMEEAKALAENVALYRCG